MKKSMVSAFMVIIAIMTGCGSGGEDGVTNSSNSDPPQTDTQIAEKVIGAEGGTLATDDLNLTIPEGAFDTDVTLTLYAVEADSPFGSNSLSQRFRIEGLPTDYSQPLTLKIRKIADAQDGEPYMAIGEEVQVYDSEGESDTTIDHFYLNATDEGDFLVCELGLSEGGTVKAASTIQDAGVDTAPVSFFDAEAVVIIKHMSDERHFRVVDAYGSIKSAGGNGPKLNQTDVDNLLDYFEEAYENAKAIGFKQIKEAGFSDVGRDFTQEPLEIKLWWGPGGVYFYKADRGYVWKQASYISLGAELNSGFNSYRRSNLKQLAYHFFLLSVLDLYDPIMVWNNRPPHQWLNEAVATWFEYKYIGVGSESFTPFYSFLTDPNKMLSGLLKDSGNSHGFNKAGMIRYLVESYGEQLLPSIYDKIKEEEHHITALLQSTDEPSGWQRVWMEEYYNGVMQNQYRMQWGSFDPKPIRFNSEYDSVVAKEYIIVEKNDNEKSMNYGVVDLSASIIRVKLYDPAITGLKISIDVTTDSHLTIFRWKDDQVGYENLGDGKQEATVNIPDGTKEVLVMITNGRAASPYTDTTTYKLNVEAKRESIAFPISYYGKGRIKKYYDENPWYWNNQTYPIETINLWCNEDTNYLIELDADGYVEIWVEDTIEITRINAQWACGKREAPLHLINFVPYSGTYDAENRTFTFNTLNNGDIISGSFSKNSISGATLQADRIQSPSYLFEDINKCPTNCWDDYNLISP